MVYFMDHGWPAIELGCLCDIRYQLLISIDTCTVQWHCTVLYGIITTVNTTLSYLVYMYQYYCNSLVTSYSV